VLAVAVDDDGRVVWAQGTGDGFSTASLAAEPGQTCEQLAARPLSWVQVLAYWEITGRPAALDPTGSGRPCSDRFPADQIDAVLADPH
jgi:hypothetical protein